jgi:tetratricopeptide (TPR) repeat protein
VPGFEILQTLGRGGMGVVYLARQLHLNRLVALKMVLAGSHSSEEDRLRFLAEAETIAKLQHPSIVQVHEFGTHEGKPYFALEYVSGGNLDQFLHATPQPPREAAQFLILLAEAMQVAHGKGIIHRDLKPGNILLELSERCRRAGETPPLVADNSARAGGARLNDFIPKISDFGLAKQLEGGDDITATGMVLGTPSYMAPEQAGGKRGTVGPATDIYALGAILYEMLTGRPPFQGLHAMETALQVLSAEPVPPHRLVPTVPRDLETICLKCLHKESSRRYASAAALADDLRRFLDGQPIQARPVGRMERLRKWAQRRPAVAGLLTALFLVLAGSFAALSWLYLDADRQRQEALQAKDDARAAEAKAKQAEARATQAATQAREAEEQARKSAAQAAAINRFFIEDFLSQILPAKARSRTITLEEVLTRAASRLGEVFAGQPELEFQMRALVGRAYSDLGRYTDALPHLERALHLGQEVFGAEHARTLAARANVAGVRERLRQEPSDIKEMRELLAKQEQLQGPDHPETLAALNNLAGLLMRHGHLKEAESLYRTMLERSNRVLGKTHPTTLAAQSNLGFFLYRQNRPQEAEPLLRAAAVGLKKVLGEEHPTTITSENNWALALLALGQATEAEKLFRRTLEARQRVLGPEHPDTLTAQHNVAGVYYMQQRFAEAEQLFREVLQLRRRIMGPEHPDTLTTLDNLSQAVFRQKKHAEAVPLLRELYDLYRRKFGATHSQTQRTLANLASEMANAGRYLEAEPLLRQVYTHRLEKLGPEHPETLAALMQQGYCRLQAGSPTEAEPLLRRCLEARRRVLGPLHADTHTTLIQLARALASSKRFDEAEALLLEMCRAVEQDSTMPPAQKRQVWEKLIQLYEESGQPDKAAPWRKKLEAIQAV